MCVSLFFFIFTYHPCPTPPPDRIIVAGGFFFSSIFFSSDSLNIHIHMYMVQHTNNKRDEEERESEKKTGKNRFSRPVLYLLGHISMRFIWVDVCVRVISFYFSKKNWLLLLLTCYLSIVCVHAIVFFLLHMDRSKRILFFIWLLLYRFFSPHCSH